MKKSLVSLAAMTATTAVSAAHAQSHETIVGASTAWPNTGKKPVEDRKPSVSLSEMDKRPKADRRPIHIDADPISLPHLKGNDERFVGAAEPTVGDAWYGSTAAKHRTGVSAAAFA